MDEYMNTLILVLAVIAVSVFVLIGVAFHRGLFRLASPTEPRVEFVLMRKKDKNLVDPKITPESAKSAGLTPAKTPTPNGESR